MGGHGGLNILPQKRWNVYNFDNREKVKKDEEAAAKEEQIKREQSRKRDTEFRIEQLRQARGLASRGPDRADEEPPSSTTTTTTTTTTTNQTESVAEPSKPESDSKQINLFEGIRIFDPIKIGEGKREEKKSKFGGDSNKNKKIKREEVRVVGPEDEMYKLGYGVAGKGVKLPWYLEKKVAAAKSGDEDENDDDEQYDDMKSKKRQSGGKKTLEELREERLKREKKEKERERALFMNKSKKDGGFSSRRR